MLQTELNRRRVMKIQGGIELLPYIVFHSPQSFSIEISTHTKTWDGQIEYSTDGVIWNIWNGENALSSVKTKGLHQLAFRGINLYVTGNKKWVLNGIDISCDGDMRNLLNYQDVENLGTLGDQIFEGMFEDCSALVKAPDLSQVPLTNYCFARMFIRTSISESPVLPAMVLKEHCYEYMFYGCTQLQKITMLGVNINAQSCLKGWVNGVSANGTFYKNAGATTLPTGDDGIPSGWTVEDYVG